MGEGAGAVNEDQRNKEIKQDRAFVRKKTVMRVCH